MAEDNKNIKVNIIKKTVTPEPAKKVPEEVVEKKKVVVKLKTPVKQKQVVKVKETPREEKVVEEPKKQASTPAPESVKDRQTQERPPVSGNPRIQGQQRPTRPGEKPYMAGQKPKAEPPKEAKREVIDGKSFMGSTTHNANTRIQSTIHNGPVIIRAAETAPAPEPQSNKPRVQGIVGGRPTGQKNYGQRGQGNYRQNGERNSWQNRDGQNQKDGQNSFQRQGGGRSYTPPNRAGQNGSFQRQGNNRPQGSGAPRFSNGPRSQNVAPAPMELNQKNGARKTSANANKRKDKDNRWQKDEELDFALQKKKVMEMKLSAVPSSIDIMENITVADLAKKMNLKASDIISKLFKMGMMVTINQQIDHETAEIIASEYGCSVHLVSLYDETVIEQEEDREEDMVPRPPIVTVMGHVDHGKTKTLDAIRSTNVVAGEYGGITQHIGAYKVSVPDKGEIVFLDTPGHAAFSMMRARGAQVTDIVVLVVAANDGVMPQTREAIDHAKAAKVPIIVAINKCDLPEANPDRVKQQLSDLGLMPEEWGGQTLYCEISALKKIGIDDLLDTILLQAEMLELKANPNCRAVGKVLESRIDQGRGTVATVIVQKGTLHQGDYYVAGIYSGRVRAMFDDKGRKITEAGPSTPVEIIGLSNIPSAGDPFQVTEDEKTARSIATKRQELERLGENSSRNKVTLENLNEKIKEGQVTDFNVIIKGDVQGSVEALTGVLEKLSTPEIKLNVIRASAGAIIESDITLASASNAVVIGFNVRPTPRAQALANEEKVEIKKYNIIYDVVDDIKAAMEGMLSPETREVDIGKVEVRDTFKVPKVGIIAGCMVTEGKIKRNSLVRVIRDSIQISQSLIKISSLKRFKDDAKEVLEGFECGVGLENWQDLQVGDILEVVDTEEVKRTLEFDE
ncbi:MAG: translation initiation factor IF-2 [Candidatus Ornithospirochaeta sp.]